MTAADAREPINRRRFLMLAGGTIVAVSCSSEPASELGSSTTLPGSGSSSTTVAALQARLFANDGSDNVPSAPPGEVGRVIVVGAGLAGLTAARALHLSGAEVLVLEGRERIGGRTHTSHLGDAAVDLGAAWVHPGNESPLAPLFSAIDVPLLPAGLTDLVLQARVYDRSSGSYPDSAAANTLLSLLAPLALGDPNDVLTGPADETLGAVIDRLAAQASGDPRAVAGAANAVKGLFGLNGGSNVDTEVATLFLGEGPDETGSDDEAGEEGEDVDRLPQGGFRTINEALAEGLDIRLGVGVDSIVETDSGVVVTSEGEEFAGSHVVATVPLGVLKSEAIRFDPPLDQAKQT
ncbi:MAG: NAD(P)-binding protein, partial [Actinomycetia bacterium]|nr:NAD(P)-binding protein [Actinomycetes bacterium]